MKDEKTNVYFGIARGRSADGVLRAGRTGYPGAGYFGHDVADLTAVEAHGDDGVGPAGARRHCCIKWLRDHSAVNFAADVHSATVTRPQEVADRG
jgi:hypothetical protein